jgi:hypothetical protein
MSTKNLARSIIEGGRCGHYKSEVSERIREERTARRAYLRAAIIDPECVDDEPAPVRRPVYPCFDDKLGPIYSFLDSRVGRRWDAVRSELFQKFDTRTTPGRHVIFDHLLKDVRESQEPIDKPYAEYFVDEEGRLAKKTRARRRARPWEGQAPRPKKEPTLQEVATWLGPRKVGKLGATLQWFVSAWGRGGIRAYAGREAYWKIIYVQVDASGEPIRDPILPTANITWPWWSPKDRLRVVHESHPFRQSGTLGPRDHAFFLSLPAHVQEMLLEMAPVRM